MRKKALIRFDFSGKNCRQIPMRPFTDMGGKFNTCVRPERFKRRECCGRLERRERLERPERPERCLNLPAINNP